MTVQGTRITTRDLEILKDLSDLRYLTVDQLHHLHFPSRPSADLRLRRLKGAGYVCGQSLPALNASTTRLVFSLSRKGAEALRPVFDGRLVRHQKRSERRSVSFVDHTLRRNDLRVVLELLHEALDVQLVSFRHLPEEVAIGTTQWVRGERQRHVAIPDALVAVLAGGECLTFLVEIDLATVSLARMGYRYATYEHWWREGGATRRFGGAPLRVLTFTTTERHVQSLAKVAPRSNLFWFATLDALNLEEPGALLNTRWLSARGETSTLCRAPRTCSRVNAGRATN